VIGHAFVGAATAVATDPWVYHSPARVSGFWMPVLVGLAYLPDLPGSLVHGDWFITARILGHSAVFAVVAGVIGGLALAHWARVPFPRAVALAVLSILAHDLLDLLQGTARVPFWPFWSQPMGFRRGLLPKGAWSESLLFGTGFALFWIGWGRALSRHTREERARLGQPAARVAGFGLTLMFGVAAVLTHVARDVREGQYGLAQELLTEDRYREALVALDQAAAWPSTTAPGRIDYLRGEAYAGLNDPGRAEESYRRSYQAEPDYFWVVADLAAFYAGCDRPLAERRRLTEPLLARLRVDFASEETLPDVLARIERKLAAPQGEGDRR
jgi:hypothetical protein